MNFNQLTDELKRDEGFESRVYTCSAGKQTVGYGWNLEDMDMPEHIAELLLQHAIGKALEEAEKFPWFFELSESRQRVIINMIYNLGINRFKGFKKMIAAIERKEYFEAAAQMKDSLWYRQVGDRARRLIEMMLDG